MVKKSTSTKSDKLSVTFLVFYTLATIGLYAALLTPVIIGLSLKMATIDPAHKENSLALVLGVGAALALVSNPFFGKLSDRTRSRFGMRRPWLVGGSLFGLLGLLIIATSTSVGMVLVGWCVAQTAFNAALAALTAVLPDQISERRRGTVSGFLGIAISIGVLAGIFLAQAVGNNQFLLFMAPGAGGVLLVLIFSFVLKDRKLSLNTKLPIYSFVEFLKSFWLNPLKNRDYTWAWLSRFILFLGIATFTSYQTYFLLDKLHVAENDVAIKVFIATLISSVIVVIASIIGGALSDKLQRRKGFVVIAALIYAAALYILATADSISMFFVGAAIAGLGQGIYLAVDLALVTMVLPNKKDSAKDLGIFNIANAAPQSIAPAIAPFFLAINGPRNYTSLFIAGVVFAVIGALCVMPIRRVK